MSLKQWILGSHKCNLGHDHSNEEDMTQCNDMEQKRRDMEYKKLEQLSHMERLKREEKLAEEQRNHEKEMMKMNLELERMRQENNQNEKSMKKSKVCNVM